MSVPKFWPQVYLRQPGLVHTGKPSAPPHFPPRPLSWVVAGSNSEPRIFLVPLTRQTRGALTFLAGPIFLVLFQRGFFPFAVSWWNPFHVIWEGRKISLVVFFVFAPPPPLFNPNYFPSNYPARVYTFFSRTLWPCCGRSELCTHYRCCLPPNTQLKCRHPPHRSLSQKVAELIRLQ